jgi:hypothetical protein
VENQVVTQFEISLSETAPRGAIFQHVRQRIGFQKRNGPVDNFVIAAALRVGETISLEDPAAF